MGKIKLSNKKKKNFKLVSGLGFILMGLFMIFKLNDVRGQFPLFLGIGILLWRI